MNTFSIVPIEVFMDDRLNKNDIRVLGAILSYRNQETNLCWPTRKQISDRCNLPLTRISTITTRLVNLGWLVKEGNGGCSRASNYALKVPKLEEKTVTETVTKTVTKPVTVTNTETVTETVTRPVTETVTRPVTETVTRIKQTIEQTIEQTNKQTRSNVASELSTAKDADIVIEFPLNTKSMYPITKENYDSWCELYPAVDVIAELRKMRGWLDANPKKRKTKGGVPRFVNSWLAREQDNPKPLHRNQTRQPTQPQTRQKIPRIRKSSDFAQSNVIDADFERITA